MEHAERTPRERSTDEPAPTPKPGGSTLTGRVQRKAAGGRTGGDEGGAAPYESGMTQAHGIEMGGAPAFGAATGGGRGGRSGGSGEAKIKQATATTLNAEIDIEAVTRIVGAAAKGWGEEIGHDVNLVIDFSVYGNGELFDVSVPLAIPEDIHVREYVRERFERLRFPPTKAADPAHRIAKGLTMELSLRPPPRE